MSRATSGLLFLPKRPKNRSEKRYGGRRETSVAVKIGRSLLLGIGELEETLTVLWRASLRDVGERMREVC